MRKQRMALFKKPKGRPVKYIVKLCAKMVPAPRHAAGVEGSSEL